MLIFVFTVACYKDLGMDPQVGVATLLAVAFGARLSGANISLSITLSNVLRKENKYHKSMLLLYFGAQMFGTLVAMMLA